MDCVKVGKIIKKLRIEKNMKQFQLAEKMNISDKTVSKWERGLGVPDVNLLQELSAILGTTIENILAGNLYSNDKNNGNIKNLKFYICPLCGNLITSFDETSVYCCGKKIEYTKPLNSDEEFPITIEKTDNCLYISSDKNMTKENYVTFIAYLLNDTYIVKRLYPEWNFEASFPYCGYGKIIFGTNKNKLYYKNYYIKK